MSGISRTLRLRSTLAGSSAKKYAAATEQAKELCGVSNLTHQQRDALIGLARNTFTAPEGVMESLLLMPMSRSTIESGLEIKTADIVTTKTTEPSISDPRLGASDNVSACGTCGNGQENCPGHMGFVRLPSPIPNPIYIDYLIAILNSVCLACGSALMSVETMRQRELEHLKTMRRLKQIGKESMNMVICQSCKTKVHKYKFDAENIEITNTEDSTAFDIRSIYKTLQKLPKDVIKLLGFESGTEPKDLIMFSIPIIPPSQRPTIKIGDMYRIDPITTAYQNMLRDIFEWTSLTRKPTITDTELNNIRAKIKAVYNRYKDMIFKKDSNNSVKISDVHGSITKRLGTKEGLIRQNAVAKRTDRTARTVAGPAPDLRIGQIAVPEILAQKLTQPMIINTDKLLEMAQKLYAAGKVESIQRGLYTYYITDENRDRYAIEMNDIVHRHLMDGDYVVMNRQPTLTMYSIMGYEVVLYDGLTLRIPLPSCKPHNADFDGDELNINVPQDPKAIEEIANEMSVAENFLSRHTNTIISAPVMNAKTGLYVLTRPDSWVDFDDFLSYNMLITSPKNIFEFLAKFRSEIKKANLDPNNFFRSVEYAYSSSMLAEMEHASNIEVREFAGSLLECRRQNPTPADKTQVSGFVVFSLILPSNFEYRPDNNIWIHKGMLLKCSSITKYIGDASNSIGHMIAFYYGSKRGIDFVTDASWLGEEYINRRGLSVGTADCFLENPEIQRITQAIVDDVRQFVVGAYDRDLTTAFDKLERQNRIQVKTNVMAEIGNKIMPYVPTDNALVVMAKAGAKGGVNNVVQILSLIGQQYQNAEIAPPTLSNGQRMLPTRSIFDNTAEAHGFCTNSFGRGLSAEEFFCHSMSTRDSLMGTALRTQDIGALKRRLEQSLRDAINTFQNSLVSFGLVLQFATGNNIFDPRYIKRVQVENEEIFTPVDVLQEMEMLNSED